MSEQVGIRHYTIAPDAPQTEKQYGYLRMLMRDYDWRIDMVVGCAYEMFGIDAISDLTRLQMSQLIDRIAGGPKWVDKRQQRLGI